MPHAYAVIGANFGDEGKGLITDYLCAKKKADYCIRFNGGAQAGHTVVMANGRRHVFHHFGSGTFAGAATVLSRYFIVNPVLFHQEFAELNQKETFVTPVFVDPDCYVTLPHDMLVNQLIERARGSARHGSCGVGINETIERAQSGYPIFASELIPENRDKFLAKLHKIIHTYYPHRLMALGLTDSESLEALRQPSLETLAQSACSEFGRSVICINLYRLDMEDKTLVFEGAQGLLLSEERKEFHPHVTRSTTGVRNVLTVCNELGIRELHAVYVTRPYLTRHGAGRLPGEELWKTQAHHHAVDRDWTNVPNEFQGTLRYAPLDEGALYAAVAEDAKVAYGWGGKFSHEIAITHTDEWPIEELSQHLVPNGALVSNGPTREDVGRVGVRY